MDDRAADALRRLRAHMDAGRYTGPDIRRLAIRAVDGRPTTTETAHLIDQLHSYLEAAAYEAELGAPLFSLDRAREILDEIEAGIGGACVDPALETI